MKCKRNIATSQSDDLSKQMRSIAVNAMRLASLDTRLTGRMTIFREQQKREIGNSPPHRLRPNPSVAAFCEELKLKPATRAMKGWAVRKRAAKMVMRMNLRHDVRDAVIAYLRDGAFAQAHLAVPSSRAGRGSDDFLYMGDTPYRQCAGEDCFCVASCIGDGKAMVPAKVVCLDCRFADA
mmetsp:Transcript_25173/g.46130  ORF Transcript_25173/g.46130 Transcript_25173/m.46130 type:complete len:180 (-) Transcript_25173:90-629(-)